MPLTLIKTKIDADARFLGLIIGSRRVPTSRGNLSKKGYHLCDNCLLYDHRASAGPKPRFCRVTRCNGNHCSFPHPRSVEQAPSPTRSANQLSGDSPLQASESVAEAISSYVQGKKRLVQKDNLSPSTATGLAAVPVKVRSPDRNEAVTTYALLDTG